MILNVPHGQVMQDHLRHSLAQLRKSWYSSPSRRRSSLKSGSAGGIGKPWPTRSSTAADPARSAKKTCAIYRQAWSQPGAVTAMLNWYRALVQQPPAAMPDPRIKVPTLMIWGEKDAFLGRELAQPSIDLCDQGRLEYLDTTHWVQHEEPERVNALIAGFIA